MHRYIPLPFKAAGFGHTSSSTVTVSLLAVSAQVDLESGTIVSGGRGGSYQRAAPADAPLAVGDLLVTEAHRDDEAAGGYASNLCRWTYGAT